MVYSSDLYEQMQVSKHLKLSGDHDQKDHAPKSKKGGGKGSDKSNSLTDRLKDEFSDDGDLSLGEATLAAGLAAAVGVMGFKKGAHRSVAFSFKGNKMTTAHGVDAFKQTDSLEDVATMIGDNLNGIGKHTASYHPGKKFWDKHMGMMGHADLDLDTAGFGKITTKKDVVDQLQKTTGNWTGGMHKNYNASLGDPINNPYKVGSPELLQAVSTSAIPTSVPDLHRGMSLGKSDVLRLHGGKSIKLDDIAEGVEFDLVPKSFSTKKSVAAKFGTGYGLNSSPDTGGYVDTVITVKKKPQRTGLNVDPVTHKAYQFEDEWIMGGTFKVTEVRKGVMFNMKPTKRHIIVEQVAPPDFDYKRAKNMQDTYVASDNMAMKLVKDGADGFELPDSMSMDDVKARFGSDDIIPVKVSGLDETVELTPYEIGFLDQRIKKPSFKAKNPAFSPFEQSLVDALDAAEKAPPKPTGPLVDPWDFEGKPPKEFSEALEEAYLDSTTSAPPSIIDELVKEPPPGGGAYDVGGAYEQWIKGLSPAALDTYLKANNTTLHAVGMSIEDMPQKDALWEMKFGDLVAPEPDINLAGEQHEEWFMGLPDELKDTWLAMKGKGF